VFVGEYLSQEVSGVYLNVSVANTDGGFQEMYEPIFATNDCPDQGMPNPIRTSITRAQDIMVEG